MSFVIAPRDEKRSPAYLPNSLERLIDSLQKPGQITPSLVRQRVLDAAITVADLLPWADFKHPVTDSYGRRLVFNGGHFEIMVMSWMPGDFSAIHDHGAAQWGAVQCFGAAEHYVYELNDNYLTTRASLPYAPGDVRAVDHQLIHQMGNAGRSPFLSLHVYGCDQPSVFITANARIFNLFEQCIQYTNGGVFLCLHESQITQRRYGIRGDAETLLRHHLHLRDRIQQILATTVPPCAILQAQIQQINTMIRQLQP